MDAMTSHFATTALAARLRGHALRMTNRARASHIGSCLSMADILAVLYGSAMRTDPARPDWAMRDRLVVSKGHAAAIVYAVLAERGFISIDELETYAANGSRLAGHVTKTVPGVELSTGSLGHGLPVAAGMALAAKRAGADWRAFCILSDLDSFSSTSFPLPLLFICFVLVSSRGCIRLRVCIRA